MKKQRIEDLGRIAELLKTASDHDLFDWNNCKRPKDTVDWFFSLDESDKQDTIHAITYQLNDLMQIIIDAYQIARWGDMESDEDF